MRILLAAATLAASLPHGAWAGNAPATDSLPPLVDGKIPTNLDELWGNYDPVEVVREWKEGDITMPPDPHLAHHRGQPSPRDRPYAPWNSIDEKVDQNQERQSQSES